MWKVGSKLLSTAEVTLSLVTLHCHWWRWKQMIVWHVKHLHMLQQSDCLQYQSSIFIVTHPPSLVLFVLADKFVIVLRLIHVCDQCIISVSALIITPLI